MELAERMKAYEDCWRSVLPRRLPVIVRVDGRSFCLYRDPVWVIEVPPVLVGDCAWIGNNERCQRGAKGMTVQVGDQTYKLKFVHFRNGTVITKTECEVMADDIRVSFGMTLRNPKDNPNKEIARKIALQRAVALFPRHVRAEFWRAYLGRKNGGTE